MYYTESAVDVCEALATSASCGLTVEEARLRLLANGRNEIAQRKPPNIAAKLFKQVNEPMIYILLAAAAFSIWQREWADAAVIAAVITINGVIGVLQESKAEASLAALKRMTGAFAAVRRGGEILEVSATELVAGDIVLLEAGRVVAADLRLISTANLKIEESALTGESVPVEKEAAYEATRDTPIAERVNMAYSSTAVTYGRGEGVVVATGMETEVGKIAGAIANAKEEPTPLQARLSDIGKVLGIVCVVICAALLGVCVLQGRDIAEMAMSAVSLAVAAVPEGLPAVVTIVLAIGVTRLVKAHTIVRRLPSVETLGAVSVVCTDKTGTLTINKMRVKSAYINGALIDDGMIAAVDDATLRMFLTGFTLCNDATENFGDPTEIALIDMGQKNGYDRPTTEKTAPRVGEMPFDSDRKLMTTAHKDGDAYICYTKGAMDNLLEKSAYIFENGISRPITKGDKGAVCAAAGAMASGALRVLGLAFKHAEDLNIIEEGLTFVGLVGMIDPARPEARQSVAALKSAGIRTVMITGDHRDTAAAIAKDLRIIGEDESGERVMSGAEIDALTDDEFAEIIDDIRVFARVSPSHKVRIVTALKARGHIVSMTGDGVNDAPSLKAADIGVAMGITGTDVAKGAADMVLTDDNFATIEKAVEEGRGIYENIKKTVVFLLSSNLGEIITMFGAICAGLAAPLAAIHILWVNLVTDSLPALALGVDTPSPQNMKKPPRKQNESLFASGGLAATLGYGALVGGLTLFAFLLNPILEVGFSLQGIDNWLSLDTNLRMARTYALVALCMSQLFHAIGMRDVTRSVFRMNHTKNVSMLVAVGAGLILQVAVTEVPLLIAAFKTVGLGPASWAVLALIASAPLVAHEVVVLIIAPHDKSCNY